MGSLSRSFSRGARTPRGLQRLILLLSALTLGVASPAIGEPRVSLGLDYWSDYFWRGFRFYGDADSTRGVLFPWTSRSWRGLSFSAVGELPQSRLGGNPNATEKVWAGFRR